MLSQKRQGQTKMILGNVNKMHSIDGAKKGNQARIIKFTTYLHTLSATLVKQKN